MEAEDIPFPAEYLAKLVKLVDQGTISTTIAKKVLEIMFEQKKDPQEIVREEGLEVVSDEKALAEVVKKVISNNTKLVEDYKKGKDKVFGFLVGQAMKETKGKANPRLLNKILKEELDKI